MINTGHEQRTRAVIEHAKRIKERHTETRVELAQEAIDLMLELTQQIEALKARDAEREREIASLKSDLRVIVQASAHLTEAA